MLNLPVTMLKAAPSQEEFSWPVEYFWYILSIFTGTICSNHFEGRFLQYREFFICSQLSAGRTITICLLPSNFRALRHRKSHNTLLFMNLQDLRHCFL